MIKPLGDRVILTAVQMKSDSVLIMPRKKDTQFGKVVDVGGDSPVRIGDIVVYDINDFHEVDYKNEKYLIVKYDNILAKIED